MNTVCAHHDYIGDIRLQRCHRRAEHKAWRHRHAPDFKATWLCWHHFYREYLESSHWEFLRLRKIRTVGKRCQRCGITGGLLHIHHRTYKTLGQETLDDLEVLCIGCHEQHHGRRTR